MKFLIFWSLNVTFTEKNHTFDTKTCFLTTQTTRNSQQHECVVTSKTKRVRDKTRIKLFYTFFLIAGSSRASFIDSSSGSKDETSLQNLQSLPTMSMLHYPNAPNMVPLEIPAGAASNGSDLHLVGDWAEKKTYRRGELHSQNILQNLFFLRIHVTIKRIA